METLNMQTTPCLDPAVWSAPAGAPEKKSPFDLTDKTIVVTGGGGILGRGMCAALASQGARVAVVEMNPAPTPRSCRQVCSPVATSTA